MNKEISIVFLIGNNLYSSENNESEKLSLERDKIIDEMIEVRKKRLFNIGEHQFFMTNGKLIELGIELKNIEKRLKEICPYLSVENTNKFMNDEFISSDDWIRDNLLHKRLISKEQE